MSRGLRIELAELRRGLCMACALIWCASTNIFLKGVLTLFVYSTNAFTLIYVLNNNSYNKLFNWLRQGHPNQLSRCTSYVSAQRTVHLCPTTQTLWCGLLTWSEWTGSTWMYLPLLCLTRDSSVVWDLERLTCGRGFRTPPWLTWCGLEYLKSSWKRSRKGTHTHTLPTHSLTQSYIYTLSLVSHTPIH